jgi:hypothetical protein
LTENPVAEDAEEDEATAGEVGDADVGEGVEDAAVAVPRLVTIVVR